MPYGGTYLGELEPRADASKPKTPEQNADGNRRLLAKLVRELLQAETFDTLADLTAALKFRCARLRIPWTPTAISDAFRLVASNRSLVPPPSSPPRRIEPDVLPLTANECGAILRRLGVTV